MLNNLPKRPNTGQTMRADRGPKTCDYINSHWPQVACILVCYRTIKQAAQRIWDQGHKQGSGCSSQWLSFLQRSGGQGSLPGVRNLPGGKSPGARLTTLCNILLGVATSFLKGLPTTAGNSSLRCGGMLKTSLSYWVSGLPKRHNWLVAEQIQLSWLKARFVSQCLLM